MQQRKTNNIITNDKLCQPIEVCKIRFLRQFIICVKGLIVTMTFKIPDMFFSGNSAVLAKKIESTMRFINVS